MATDFDIKGFLEALRQAVGVNLPPDTTLENLTDRLIGAAAFRRGNGTNGNGGDESLEFGLRALGRRHADREAAELADRQCGRMGTRFAIEETTDADGGTPEGAYRAFKKILDNAAGGRLSEADARKAINLAKTLARSADTAEAPGLASAVERILTRATQSTTIDDHDITEALDLARRLNELAGPDGRDPRELQRWAREGASKDDDTFKKMTGIDPRDLREESAAGYEFATRNRRRPAPPSDARCAEVAAELIGRMGDLD